MKFTKPYRAAMPIVAALLLGGCAAQDMGSQALEPGAENLDTVQNNLVYLAVRTRPYQASLKLSGLVFIDRATGKWHIQSYFDNPLLGSDNVPHTVDGKEVLQDILIDLPTGEYQLAKADFVFLWKNATGSSMKVDVDRELVLRVGSTPHTYAGRLTFQIDSITVDGLFETRKYTFPLDSSVTVSNISDELLGELTYIVEDHMEEDLARAIEQYPGLGTVKFSRELLR